MFIFWKAIIWKVVDRFLQNFHQNVRNSYRSRHLHDFRQNPKMYPKKSIWTSPPLKYVVYNFILRSDFTLIKLSIKKYTCFRTFQYKFCLFIADSVGLSSRLVDSSCSLAEMGGGSRSLWWTEKGNKLRSTLSRHS